MRFNRTLMCKSHRPPNLFSLIYIKLEWFILAHNDFIKKSILYSDSFLYLTFPATITPNKRRYYCKCKTVFSKLYFVNFAAFHPLFVSKWASAVCGLDTISATLLIAFNTGNDCKNGSHYYLHTYRTCETIWAKSRTILTTR